MVSQWKQSCLLSELSDRWCLLRWKSCDWKRWEHAGEQCHTPRRALELAVDGRHESVQISCNRDGGVVRARTKVQT